MTIGLLILIAACLVWLCVQPYAEPAWHRARHRRRLTKVELLRSDDSGAGGVEEIGSPIRTPEGCAQLLLCDSRGHVEHEISWHGSELPSSYEYAGKAYARVHSRRDGSWEYRR